MNTFEELPANAYSIAKRKLILGIGINDVNYQVSPKVNGKTIFCPYYSVWRNMLKRCYCIQYQRNQPTYIECTVCKEWLTFSNFKEWMQSQDWEGKELDKDLLLKGNKVYSPETCIFVTRAVNSLLGNHAASRGKYVTGICWSTRDKKFIAQCSVRGVRKTLGYFNTEEEAEKVYKYFKKNHILEIANEQLDLRLKNALIHTANEDF